VTPEGLLPEGTQISLILFIDQIAIPAPTNAPTFTSGAVVEGQTGTVNWTNFTCPSGTSNLSSYEVTLTNGKFANGSAVSSFDPNTRTATFTVDTGKAGQVVTATYRAFCGDRASGTSPQGQSIAITAPTTGTNPGTDASADAEADGDSTAD